MNKRRSIAILDFDDINNPLLGAGQARATVEVGKRLSEKGYDITVVTSKYPGYKDRYENGMFYKHIGISTPNIRVNNFIYIVAIPFAVSQLKVDLILECFTAPISTLCSPLWTKIPVIAISTTFDAKRFSKQYHVPFDIVEKFGVKLYKYFLPFSYAIDQQMKKLNPRVTSKIVPPGVGSQYFSIRKQKGEYILYLGRLELYQKGIDLLFRAYKEVENTIGYPLVMAGDGPDKKKIQELIKSMGLERKVMLVGPKHGSKKYGVLSKALFFVVPSRAETFSIASLEALATGLPIVAFDIPGLSWIDNHVVLKAEQEDAVGFSKLLKRATNRELLTTMGNRGREFASSFSWDRVADEYDKFIRYVIQKERGAYEKSI